MSSESEQLRHLRWKCRRGTLELDTVLRKFVDDHYLSLSTADQKVFHALLEAQDPLLWQWLMGEAIPQNAEWDRMIVLMRRKLFAK